MSIVLGAIADDFTGATDLANTWVKAGVKVVQVIGVPEDTIDLGDAEAVVVALKSRTAPVAEAITSSLAALDWLRALGADQIAFKYCSTFDSTDEGNIGPVADALTEALDTGFALVCPAFPENGRTIYQGHLFVGAQLLSESPMKDHPLTPMRDSDLVTLMERQSHYRAGRIPWQTVQAGPNAIRAAITELQHRNVRYGIVDALSDADLLTIGIAAADHALVTGGSGVGMGLPENARKQGRLGDATAPSLPQVQGRALVLAGSCSAATRAQLAKAKDHWPTRKLDPDELAVGDEQVRAARDWALAQPDDAPVVIYASADPEEVAQVQARYGVERAGGMIEAAFSTLAQELSAAGFTRIVVAGGETSGAVVSALGVTALRIGPEIAPGVPWTETGGDTPLALALKSGNFGGPEFFQDALGMLP